MNDFVDPSKSKINYMKKNLDTTKPHYREQIFASPFPMARFHCMRVTVLIFVVELQKVCTTCIHSHFWVRTGESFKTASTSVHEKKYSKKRFYGICTKIEQSKVGHNVITLKLEGHINRFSTTLTIEGLGDDHTLNSTIPCRLCTFSTLWDSSQPEKTTMENAINASLLSMFLQKLKSSFSRRPSWYEQWDVHSLKLEGHLVKVYSITKLWNQLGNKAMCKDVSCFTYDDQPTKDTLILQSF